MFGRLVTKKLRLGRFVGLSNRLNECADFTRGKCVEILNDPTAAFKEYATGPLLVLDLIGTFVFALSGAVVGVKRRLDIFGVLVISFAAATAGGIMRHPLIDSVPPAAIRDWRYMAASVLGGLLIFIWFPRSQQSSRLRNFVLLFDAGGLALLPSRARKRLWAMF